MIGNWVKDYDTSNTFFQVIKIEHGDNEFTEGLWFINGRMSDDVLPVNLTSGILLDNGFSYVPEHSTYGNKKIGVALIGNKWYCDNVSGKYLHQFQNYYFLKTGKELNIVL